MKFYLIIATTLFLFSSCLKQSIADAMLNKQSGQTASLSYELNGSPVQITVANAGNQNPSSYTLGVSKSTGFYILSGLGSTGETSFLFFTDSLTTTKYTYTGIYGDRFFIDYNNQAEFVHVPSDYLSFTITSYNKGLISGSFSGQLTPLIDANNNTYGAPGSIIISKGLFQNVPVFY